jgi:hypothetical protein
MPPVGRRGGRSGLRCYLGALSTDGMPLPEAITVNLADDGILERLFKLNQQRAAAGPAPAPAPAPAKPAAVA